MSQEAPLLRLGDRVVDLEQREVRRDGERWRLTPNEVGLLRYLAERPGQLIDRAELLQQVWGYAPGVQSRSVDHTVARLRPKVEDDPKNPTFLCAAYGGGYRLDLAEEPAPDPAYATSFVGRRAELTQLRRALQTERLITLVGPGGVGKTRLARQLVAQGHATAAFLELAPATDMLDIVGIARRTLSLGGSQAGDPVDAVGRSLAGRGPLLLVADNVEQVLEPASIAIARWLQAAPQLTVVATSRQALGLRSEQVFGVDPLPPDDAAWLLQERVRAVRPEGIADADAARLGDALRGLPLALELAAARCAVLDPCALLERLGLDTLARPGDGGRHGSLRRTISWSWDLLEPQEREVLASLSAFVGTFSFEAAEALCGPGTLDALQALQARSLVQRVPSTERYTLLPSVQAFAAEHRDPATTTTHAQLVVQRAESHLDTLFSVRQDPATTEGLAALTDDLLTVVRRLPGTALAARAVVALHPVHEARGPIQRLQQLAASQPVPHDPDLAARLCFVRGRAAYVMGDPEARAHLASAAVAVQDPVLRGWIVSAEGDVLQGGGHYEQARDRYEEALGCFAAGGCRLGEAMVRNATGLVALERGDLSEAERLLRESLVLHRSIRNPRGEAVALHHLGTTAIQQGDAERALQRYDEALRLLSEDRDARVHAICRGHRANALARLGRLDEAEAEWQAALALHQAQGNQRFAAVTLGSLGTMQLRRGQLERARDTLELARLTARDQDDPAIAASLANNLGTVLLAQGALDDARRCFTEARDAQRALGRARGELHAALNLGVVALRRGDLDEAEALLRTVLAQADEPRLRAHTLATLAEARARSGDAEAARALLAEAEPLMPDDPEVAEALRRARAGLPD